MEKTMLEKYYGSMSCYTYGKLQDYASLLGSFSGLASFLSLNNGVLPAFFASFSFLSFLYSFVGNKFIGENMTYDVKEVKVLYDEFIKNYNKLNKMFDLNNPIEVSKMFNYLLYKGYLSRDKEFVFDENVFDISSLRGSNVIEGNGVCRHISSMLNDIYLDLGIESYILSVYQRSWNPSVTFFDETLTEGEISELKNILYEFEDYVDLQNFIKTYYFDKVVVEKQFFELNPHERLYGNHAINMTIYNGQKCFVDATQDRVYDYFLERSVLFDEYDDKIDICLSCFEEYNKKVSFERIRSKLLLPTLGYEGNLSSKIISMVDDNLDIFEKFYRENSSLYEEISDKLKNIRVRK